MRPPARASSPACRASRRASGRQLGFAGRELTAFTNEEEIQAGLADKAPWLLEDRIRGAGGTFRSGPAWAPFVIVDDNVVTGQNPASSAQAAQQVVRLLNQRVQQLA